MSENMDIIIKLFYFKKLNFSIPRPSVYIALQVHNKEDFTIIYSVFTCK